MSRCIQSFLLLAATVLLAGCEAKIYRAETVLHSDGSISRAIYQPDDETPEAARAAAWESTTFAPRVGHEKWDQSIRELRPAERDKDRPYFAAWGEFATAADVPATFQVAAPEGLPDGTLNLDYQREDLVLFVEHRWRETLTDIVSLDDMRRARRELADVLIPTFEKIVGQGLGSEYDISALSAWLRKSGEPLAFELTDVLFELGARGELASSDATSKAMVSVLERHGVRVRDEEGHLLNDEALSKSVVSAMHRVLMENIRRHDGQAVRPAVADEILQWLGVMDVPEGFEKSERYDDAAKLVVAEQFGNQEGLALVIQPLGQRIAGLYRGIFFGPGGRRFEYSLEMPGILVETNGTILSDNAVRFRFADGDAYPFGFAMRARSIEPTGAAQKLLGGDLAGRRKQLLAYVDLVRDDEKLREIMKQCAAAGNIEPLQQARDASPPGSSTTDKYDLLMQILKKPG